MRATCRPTRRRGTVLPMIGVCLIAIFSFVALAVDLGMLAVARTQCQNAADVAALVGCRTFDNKQPDNAAYDNNRPAAVQTATDSATGSPFMAATVAQARTPTTTIRAGTYEYDTTTQTFVVSYPAAPPAGRSWTAMEVTIALEQPTYFARIWGVNGMPSGARAVAVYRPRDVAFVLDMTGSMAYASTFNYSGTHLNADPLAPTFGHYVSAQGSIIASANESNSSGEAISRNNYTMTTPGGPPIVRDYYFNPANAADPSVETTLPADRTQLKPAFHAWSPSETAGNPSSYISQTYTFTGYNAFSPRDAASPAGPTPAPDTFKSMTDGGGITYVGDRWRRADGSINKTDTTWAVGAATTRAAGTAIDLLGYNVSAGNVRQGTSGSTVIATDAQFRDPVWEQNGYDLDIVKYRTDRGNGNPLLPVGVGLGTYTPTLVAAADRYKGYSMGPGYWGKTFFIWPPDPRAPVGNPGDAIYQAGDWRRRYFDRMGTVTATVVGGVTTINYGAVGTFDPQTDANPYNGAAAGSYEGINEVLFNTGSGMTLKAATGSQSIATTSGGSTTNQTQTVDSYRIDYTQILKWIKSGPQPLPPNLRAGRVLYYSSIPNDVDTSTGTAQTKLDKKFWKEYIDYVLGYRYTSSTNMAGVADSWASAPRTLTTGDLATWTGPGGTWAAQRPYMRYSDSPNRPRMHMWFGPLSMMDFIANVNGNWNPGTCREAQCWQLKAGMNSVLDDIRNNHPNDFVGMTMFSYSSAGAYKTPRVALGQNFTALKNALFFPRSLLPQINAGDATVEMRPYDQSFTTVGIDEIPNANGSTDPNTGLMLAYNLLSPSASLSTATYGTVKGRRGASKIVIFETDGVPNSYSTGTFNTAGYNSYYSNIVNGGSPGNGVQPSMSTAVTIAQQIVKPMATGTSGDSGLSLSNAPAWVYPIGFGDLFDPVAAPTATYRPTALQFLADIGMAGGTLPTGSTSPASTQIITGSYQNRIDTLKTCMERIFQSGVTVVLIE